MKKGIRYILAGVLTLLGFTSCASLREAREARAQREREAFDAQQKALVEETLQKMLEDDARNPEKQKADQETTITGEVRIPDERVKLLYAVPNVPYREIEKK
jgi:sortase (surface protein transpeptidase)